MWRRPIGRLASGRDDERVVAAGVWRLKRPRQRRRRLPPPREMPNVTSTTSESSQYKPMPVLKPMRKVGDVNNLSRKFSRPFLPLPSLLGEWSSVLCFIDARGQELGRAPISLPFSCACYESLHAADRGRAAPTRLSCGAHRYKRSTHAAPRSASPHSRQRRRSGRGEAVWARDSRLPLDVESARC